MTNPFDYVCLPCRKVYRSSSTTKSKRVCKHCGEPIYPRWIAHITLAYQQMCVRARERSPMRVGIVFLLTLSLGIDGFIQLGLIPLVFNGLSFLNFVVHELGHLATIYFTPQFICTMSGTLFQLGLPLGSIFMFIKQRDDAAACFAGTWLAMSLQHSAWYIADARAQEGDMSLSSSFWSLTLQQPVSPDKVGHDWNYMLGAMGLLQYDTTISWMVYLLSILITVTAVLLNGIQFYHAIKTSNQLKKRKNRIEK